MNDRERDLVLLERVNHWLGVNYGRTEKSAPHRIHSISSLFRLAFHLRALAVGQTGGAGERSRGAKAVGGTYRPVPSPFSERKKSICP